MFNVVCGGWLLCYSWCWLCFVFGMMFVRLITGCAVCMVAYSL